MSSVAISLVRAGQVVAEEIRNFHGQVILARGAAITERHLAMLKAWGVTSIAVTAAGAAGHERSQEDLTAPMLERAARDVTPLFRQNDASNPVVRELCRLSVRRRARRLRDGAP